MTQFGIHSRSYHLDAVDPANLDSKELDWAGFATWYGAPLPFFAGRYFLSDPLAGSGGQWPTFVWGHGEGSRAKVQNAQLDRIIPIQAGAKDRLQLKDAEGLNAGQEDASAFCAQLASCLAIGELKITNATAQVFLDVPTGAALTGEYWAGWASAVATALSFFKKTLQGIDLEFPHIPFVPCIVCDFTLTGGKYQPDPVVKKALDDAKLSWVGGQITCHGYWARALIAPAPTTPKPNLDWTLFDTYFQDVVGGKQPVPVLLWRYMEPDAAGANVGFASLTMDAANDSSNEPKVSQQMLQIVSWDPSKQDPSSMGIDKGVPAMTRSSATCIHGKQLIVTAWPGVPQPDHPLNLRMNPAYVGRYYSDPASLKILTPGEAQVILRGGLAVVSVWAPMVPYGNPPRAATGPNMYTWLQQPKQGQKDALDTFRHAANDLHQPAYSPVYFDIDFDLGNADDAQNDHGQGADPAVHAQDLQNLLAYFTDITEGYRDYLDDQRTKGNPEVPYLIGVYGSGEVLNYCYKQGITSYYWLAAAPRWKDTSTPWPHMNIWQIAQPSNNYGQQPIDDCPLEANASGTSVTYGHNTLTDPSRSWRTDAWKFRRVDAGPSKGVVLSNNAHTLTLRVDWVGGQPANGTGYTIRLPIDDNPGGVGVTYAADGLTDPSKPWPVDFFIGGAVVAGGAHGIIGHNDAHSLTLVRNWRIQPADGTPYWIEAGLGGFADIDVSYGDEGTWKPPK